MHKLSDIAGGREELKVNRKEISCSRKRMLIRVLHLTQVEEKIADTVLDVWRYAKHILRFESSKTGCQTGVDYVPVEDLERKFEMLRDQTVYCCF